MSKEISPEAQVKADLGIHKIDGHQHEEGPRGKPLSSRNSLTDVYTKAENPILKISF